MARLGKQIPSSLYGPVARRRLMKSFRPGLSDTHDKQKRKDRRRVVKKNHGIVEKFLLVLFAGCIILCTILLLR
jgi:hypothetical protein